MTETLYTLVILACPVGMGLMMWLMMRGGKSTHETPAQDGHAELHQLRREVAELRAAQQHGPGSPLPAPDRTTRSR